MRIYLDMCCYNRPYDSQEQLKVAMETQSKLYIQDLVKAGKLDLIGSYVLDYEVSQNPFDMRREAIRRFLDENLKGYVGVERRDALRSIAEPLMLSGTKEKDAYHLAAAMYAHCTYFISTDIRLLKHQNDSIRMVTPIEFVTETEGQE